MTNIPALTSPYWQHPTPMNLGYTLAMTLPSNAELELMTTIYGIDSKTFKRHISNKCCKKGFFLALFDLSWSVSPHFNNIESRLIDIIDYFVDTFKCESEDIQNFKESMADMCDSSKVLFNTLLDKLQSMVQWSV